jgi:cysteine-rich repeat protein
MLQTTLRRLPFLAALITILGIGGCGGEDPVCGDGTIDTGEQCDDGNTTPDDGCSASCKNEGSGSCGDGSVDGGEQCDDGNLTSCDGCSATCVSEPGLACGDGIPEPTCGQPCDDGNITVGDGCTAQCTIEPIFGGGSRYTDCRSVWVVDNPANDPLTDKHGALRASQRCIDDDPTCDFDGGTPGSCTFHVRVCANAPGMIECPDGQRMAAWTLDKPSAKQAATNPTLAAVRASFTPVPGVVVGPTIEVCTDVLPVTVPLRGVPGNYKKRKVTVGSRGILYDDAGVDKDKLKLECAPAGS